MPPSTAIWSHPLQCLNLQNQGVPVQWLNIAQIVQEVFEPYHIQFITYFNSVKSRSSRNSSFSRYCWQWQRICIRCWITCCLSTKSTCLTPAYRPAPDYETAVRVKYGDDIAQLLLNPTPPVQQPVQQPTAVAVHASTVSNTATAKCSIVDDENVQTPSSLPLQQSWQQQQPRLGSSRH